MRVHIIIPYRPLCKKGLQSVEGPVHQLPDGRWESKKDDVCKYGVRDGIDEDELVRAIKFLRKNSHYKHHIIVAIDEDVFPNNNYLREFDGVTILKSGYVHNGPLATLTVNKINAATIKAIESVPDDEWLCYGYISDLICAKNWDKYIIDAIEQYGDTHIYIPMFTEIRGGIADRVVRGLDPTPERIWDEWRRTISCHSLTMPDSEKGYFTEDEMDYFIKRANEANKPLVIIERPGDRVYGYFAVIFAKAKFAKVAMRQIGHGFDLDCDNRFYTVCNLMKAVVTRSFVFHPFCAFKYQLNTKFKQ